MGEVRRVKVHICTPELVALETAIGESEDAEPVKLAVEKALAENGFGPWHSMEISEFEGACGKFVFAVPVRVYMPEFLAMLQ